MGGKLVAVARLSAKLRRYMFRCGAPRASSGAASSPSSSSSRTRVLFCNERLRVLDTRITPGATRSFEHTVPTVRWQVLHPEEPTPAPHFFEAGASSVVTNGSAVEERRDLVFEILQPPRYSEAKVAALLEAPQWPTGVGSELRLENRLARLWDFRSSHGMHKGQQHQHTLDNAFVIIGSAELDVYQPDAERVPSLVKHISAEDGDVVWNTVSNGGFEADGATPVSPQCLHSVENTAEKEFREYLIELK